MGVCLDKEYRKSNDATPATGDDNAAVVVDNDDHRQSGKKYFRKRSLKAKDVLSAKSPPDDKHPEQIVGFETNGVNNGGMDGYDSVRDVTVASNEVHTGSEILVDRMASSSDLYVGAESRFLPATKMPLIPELTKPAPEFSGTAVVSGVFKEIKLSDYKGKYVVLFFYPLDFTFVCPTEIISFSDKVGEFRDINCELIACSTDSQYSHFAWVNTPRKQGGLGNLNIPLLADKTGKIARDYGCYKEDEGIAFRGLYIIDDKGVLRQITINDLPVGRSVEETLRLVQAFQYTDKHGEVCPANWKPGAKTMKPDPTGSLEYFEKEK